MKNSEFVDSTRDGYVNYIERYLRPGLGKVAVRKIDVRTIEGFYADLRRCRSRCSGKPFVEHREEDDHDCVKVKCVEHECKHWPNQPSDRSTPSSAAHLRPRSVGGWIDSNPARAARRPRPKPPEPDPPTPTEAAKLAEEAFRMDDDWGTLVWLVMTTVSAEANSAASASPASTSTKA